MTTQASGLPPFIFVFGSNRAGIHGAGAALFARRYHHAQMGVGEGLTGSAYALPTKDHRIVTLPLEHIRGHVETFLKTARKHPELTFQVTQVGCGLAGYSKNLIAPMFLEAPSNCQFDSAWKDILGDQYTYWGTM